MLGTDGRGHQRLLPDRSATTGPGALRPGRWPPALVVLGSCHRCRAATDVSVRWRRGRGGRGRASYQMFRAAGREAERANGRRPALVVHGLEQQAVVIGGHRDVSVGACG